MDESNKVPGTFGFGKQHGTIVFPVFIDESEDADHVLSQSAFEPVWQVLKALRAHDRRLADELNYIELKKKIKQILCVLGLISCFFSLRP